MLSDDSFTLEILDGQPDNRLEIRWGETPPFPWGEAYAAVYNHRVILPEVGPRPPEGEHEMDADDGEEQS